jgi:coiled-coil domain-containing protein 130
VDESRQRVKELYEGAEVWRDNYEVNARLRKGFRVQRKVLRKEERYKEGVQDKYSLGIEILDGTDADTMRAKMIDFGGAGTSETGVEEATRRPLFAREEQDVEYEKAKTKKPKAEVKAEKSRRDLQHTLVGNTRAVVDPFLAVDAKAAPKMKLGILKRKPDAEPPTSLAGLTSDGVSDEPNSKRSLLAAALVGYDSD